jgi:hypothetical protein
MRITEFVASAIKKFPRGYIFTYSDFDLDTGNNEAVIKCLNRLAASGKIKKLAKGKFYKPEDSTFGDLQPSQYQVVKDLLERDGKLIGYLTGYSAYNELGLTTQIGNIIQIGKNEVRSKLKRGIYNISFVKQKNKITKDNILLLKILDSIRFIKTIPDTTINGSCKRLIAIIKDLTNSELQSMTKLALLYTPATRALLGALIEASGAKVKTLANLRKSLNPITIYKLSVSKKNLPTAENWNIR